MIRKKTKYDLLLKSLDIPNNMYYEWDWRYYDEGGQDDYYYDIYDVDYDIYDVDYDYLEDELTEPFYIVLRRGRGFISHQLRTRLPYRQIDMDSIYSKEKLREIKINKILGVNQDYRPPTIGELIKKKLNIDEDRNL